MNEFDYLGTRLKEPLDMTKHSINFGWGVPVKPGNKLPNGGILLSEHVLVLEAHRRESLVLCVTNSVDPFATWHRLLTSDSPLATGGYTFVDSCSWGHYFKDLKPALDNFNLRVDEQFGRDRLEGSGARS